MAFTSGNASDYKNLLALLVTFASANGWTVLEQTTNMVYLKGVGTGGTDEIYCGIETYEDTSNGHYNWELFGSINWVSGRSPQSHPLSSGNDVVFSYFWNSTIPYWMVATPRRIMMVAKVGTTYQMMHLGLINPVGTDAQYPYPILVGGMGSAKAQAYSSTNCSGFWSDTTVQNGSGRIRLPDGVWACLNSSSGSSESLPRADVMSEMHSLRGSILSSTDGEYVLEPLFVVKTQAAVTYGTIDGLFRISGYNNSSENVVTVSGINYMVFGNAHRSGYGDFCAMRLN